MKTLESAAVTLDEAAFLPPEPAAPSDPVLPIRPAEPPSVPVSFLEAFLDERSIKWMLGLGILVLLGSSLKFVTDHWHACSPFWKYFVLIAYTAGVFGISAISRSRLGLRRTGAALQGLTLGLLPLKFLALRWVAPQNAETLGDLLHSGGLLGLVVANTAFTAFASRRMLDDLLRGVPVTYWVAYVTLCVAGAVAPALPAALSIPAAFVLWGVMTVGLIKGNRHVFWLAEEQQWPRIFSFFPALLLAAQFLTIFSLNFAAEFSRSWLGFAVALVAVNVLLTTDTLVKIFQQRTGRLVFPWPAPLLLPLVTGVGLCAMALGLACSQFPAVAAVPPTALLVAVCLGTVARRTQREVFAWAMLLTVLVGYQCLPGYFAESARLLVHSAAASVQESRLPFAFYGMTYAPFLLGLIVVARRWQGTVFAVPARQVATVLASVLLAVAWTHPKAIFPVSMTLATIGALMAHTLRNPRLTWVSSIAWMSASLSLPAFLATVCNVPVVWEVQLISPLLGAAALWLITRSSANSPTPSAMVSAVSAALLAVAWIGYCSALPIYQPLPLLAVLTAGGLITLLALQTARLRSTRLGELTVVLVGVTIGRSLLSCGLSPLSTLLTLTSLAAGLWVIARHLNAKWADAAVMEFRQPALNVTTVMLAGLQLLLIGSFAFGAHWTPTTTLWLAGVVVTVWSFMATDRSLPIHWTYLACLSVTGLAGSVLAQLPGGAVSPSWWLGVEAVCGSAGLAVALQMTSSGRPARDLKMGSQIEQFSQGLLLILAVGTLLPLTVEARIAGALSLVGLTVSLRRSPVLELRHLILLTAQLHGLALGLQLLTSATTVMEIMVANASHALLPLAALAALELLTLHLPAIRRFANDGELRLVHRTGGTLLLVGALVAIPFTVALPLSPLQAAALIVLFAALAAELVLSTCLEDSDLAPWLLWPLAAVAVAYLTHFGLIHATGLPFLCSLLVSGIAITYLGELCHRYDATRRLADPLRLPAYCLPGFVALAAIARSLALPAGMVGANSVLIFAAAAWYFFRWMERRETLSLVLSLVIFNLSQFLLWTELRWSDPQLFLMPLGLSLIALTQCLNRELPADWKTGLRYVGSLAILVSPTFHIVGGGWLPLLTLMAASLAVCLLAIGLQLRPLLYSGAAFLTADLCGMVVQGSLEQTEVLWITGIALGTLVVGLGAYCENHRERLLQRVRWLTATLRAWE